MIQALMIIITSIGSNPHAAASLVSPMECAETAEEMAMSVATGEAEGLVLCLYGEGVDYE